MKKGMRNIIQATLQSCEQRLQALEARVEALEARRKVENIIIEKAFDKWDDDEKKAVWDYVEPYRGCAVSDMTPQARSILLSLYIIYSRHFDVRRRAIVYTILLGQVPASLLGNITLYNSAPNVEGSNYIITDPQTGIMGTQRLTVDDINTLYNTIPRLQIRPAYTLQYPCEHRESKTLERMQRIYVETRRGFVTGPLFYNIQGRHGNLGSITKQAAQRTLREITNALGLGVGTGQTIQFHKLCTDINID